jgi:hypothetical protein
MIKKLEIPVQNFYGGITPKDWAELYGHIAELFGRTRGILERIEKLEDRLEDE